MSNSLPKTVNDGSNQVKGSKVLHYCAVMTCSQADDACPLVMGSDLRMPIRYEDPKVADDTESEAQRYDERSAQICSETLYMMSLV
jgi:arsenate reductase